MGKIGIRLFEAVMWPLQRLPLGFHYAWGKFFSFLAKDVLHYRERVVMTNLARSFPDLKYAQINEIADGFYAHFGDIIAEMLWFGGCRNHPERLSRKQLCVARNVEPLLDSFRDSPSVMVLSSHMGNWELIGGLYQYLGEERCAQYGFGHENSCVVYRRLHNKFWDGFMGDNRCAIMGKDYQGYVESEQVFRYALEHRDKKMLYIFMTDQFPYGKSARHEVPSFLHQKTQAMIGGAALASRLGMAVYYVGYVRPDGRQYEMTFKKICDDASQMDPGEIMDTYFALLEQDIQADPSCYLWSHRRWK